jgi:hypothetical protein
MKSLQMGQSANKTLITFAETRQSSLRATCALKTLAWKANTRSAERCHSYQHETASSGTSGTHRYKARNSLGTNMAEVIDFHRTHTHVRKGLYAIICQTLRKTSIYKFPVFSLQASYQTNKPLHLLSTSVRCIQWLTRGLYVTHICTVPEGERPSEINRNPTECPKRLQGKLTQRKSGDKKRMEKGTNEQRKEHRTKEK